MKNLLKKILLVIQRDSRIEVEPGETELDFIPLRELKPRKKKIIKTTNPIVKIQKR